MAPATCSSPTSRTRSSRRSSREGFLRFFPAGDLAVSVILGEEISVDLNTRVRALEYLIQQKGLAGVTETTPCFSALLVYYDPRVTLHEVLLPATSEASDLANT